MHGMSRQNENVWHRKENKGFSEENAVVALDMSSTQELSLQALQRE
jgi:hypothetical protein